VNTENARAGTWCRVLEYFVSSSGRNCMCRHDNFAIACHCLREAMSSSTLWLGGFIHDLSTEKYIEESRLAVDVPSVVGMNWLGSQHESSALPAYVLCISKVSSNKISRVRLEVASFQCEKLPLAGEMIIKMVRGASQGVLSKEHARSAASCHESMHVGEYDMLQPYQFHFTFLFRPSHVCHARTLMEAVVYSFMVCDDTG